MMNIQYLKDRIIIDGHAETKDQCETITLLCNNLAKSDDFNTVKYESGYAEFVKVGQADELKFAAALGYVAFVFDSTVVSVTNSNGTITTSGESLMTADTVEESLTFVVALQEGYEIDTAVLVNDDSEALGTIDHYTSNTIYGNAGYGGLDGTVTITTKQTGSSTPKQTIDLSTLSGWANLANGSHQITIKAKASGYVDSASSNAVSVEKAASGHAVTITAAAGSYGVKIYDGTSSSGTLLGTIADQDNTPKTVTCASSNLYLISDNGAYTDANTVVTGGVTIVSEGSWNYNGTFKVTADGTITISLACLIEGTQITLADGSTKAIEDITYDDELLVWNFYEGKFDIAKPTWIKVAEVAPRYNLVKFSNGAEVGFVGAGGENGYHRIFNKEAGAFTHTGCKDTPNGTTTFAQDRTFPTVISQEVVEKEVKFYNVITDKHYNLFANGILTSCKLSNEYNIKDMKYVGEKLISGKEKDEYFEKIKKSITFKSTRK